ncbi:MAG: hypothetical protein KF819_24195 [Labilithrix sp.]|nr:hypothetical protein [Labilithrix sp.]
MHPARIARAALLMLALTSLACRGARFTEPPASGCPADLHEVLGACVSAKVAAAYCGATQVPSRDRRTCVARPLCEAGRAVDLLSATGACLPRREVRALAAESGIGAAADAVIGCDEGAVLVAGLGRVGCLDESLLSTPRDRAPSRGAVEGVEGRRPVDVARWARSAIGVDGASGAPALCEALAREPGALASGAKEGGKEGEARIAIALTLPNNDLSAVFAEARYLERRGGWERLSEAEATAELDRVVGPMVEALRRLAGPGAGAARAQAPQTLQASVRAVVLCRRGATRPMSQAKGEEGAEGE